MSITIPQLDLQSPSLGDFRRALVRNGIAIIDDQPDFGYLSFHWNEVLAYVGTTPHEAYIPLQYFADWEFVDRRPFDCAYQLAMKELSEALGPPLGISTYSYRHRGLGQHYGYCWWQLRNCRLVLAQDERDIQFGLDLSVRFIYDDGPIESLIYGANG